VALTPADFAHMSSTSTSNRALPIDFSTLEFFTRFGGPILGEDEDSEDEEDHDYDNEYGFIKVRNLNLGFSQLSRTVHLTTDPFFTTGVYFHCS